VRNARLAGERGTTLVEYAIVLTILLTFIFGVMDFSRYLYVYHFAADAAREATRYAAVRGSTFSTACSAGQTTGCYASAANVATYVQGITPGGILAATGPNSSWTSSTTCSSSGSVSSPTVSTCWPGQLDSTSSCNTTASGVTGVDDNPGCLVEVVVAYPFQFMLPFLPASTKTYTISSTSEVVIEQ
jgi:Flp pilus assembly protein TadG